MTCKVAFMWEFGWNTPFMEIDDWVFPCREFKVDGLYAVPISGIRKTDQILEENPLIDWHFTWISSIFRSPDLMTRL